MAGTINWSATKADYRAVDRVLARAEKLVAKAGGTSQVPQDLAMDLIACHLNGTPMDWEALLVAPDFDFVHDVWGIHKHIDRETGRLGDCFLPRCHA